MPRSATVEAPTGVGADAVTVANRLRPVLLHIYRHLRRETHALGVSSGQVSLLAAINAEPGIGVGEVAGRQGMSPPSMSEHIDRLEAAGMVQRTRGGGDRRRVGLTLTAEGQRVLRAVRSRRTAWLAQRLSTLGPDELAAVDAAVEPLRRLLEVEL